MSELKKRLELLELIEDHASRLSGNQEEYEHKEVADCLVDSLNLGKLQQFESMLCDAIQEFDHIEGGDWAEDMVR